MAQMIVSKVPARIEVTRSNDPRSYRLNSDKLLSTGFAPEFGVETAMDEIIYAYKNHGLRDRADGYNIKTMKQLMETGQL
jgi:hypothetical protein